MKLNKYLMIALAAISTVGTTVSCSDVDEVTLLDDIQVSKSFVTFDAAGGTNTIVVTADDAWSFSTASDYAIPDWVTVSPTSGSEGQTTVTFTAGPAIDTNSATVAIVCDGETQLINLLQQTEKRELPLSTCAEVNAGADDVTYRVRGVCTAIANTTYGNWYINDGTGEVYIYGTLDAKGNEKNFLSLGIEVGDEITVEGPKTTYNGTVELVNVTVVNISKSLLKCDSTYVNGVKGYELPLEGGEIKAYLTNKANGVTVNIPEEAKSWLSVTGIDIKGTSNVVTLLAAPNAGGDRSTTISFVTTDGKKTYTAEQAISQKGAILEVPVSEFLAAAENDTQYRITGIITSLYASDKQGKSFTLRDYSGEVLIYRAEGFIESGAKVGDIVTVVGKRTSYKDTPQMGTVTFEELKYAVTEVSIADFIAKEDSKEVYYMISGTVGPSVGDGTKYDLEQYGNFNLTDETGSVYIYGVTDGWGGAKGTFKNLGIVEGDKITIVAYKTSYKGLVEGVGMFFSKEAAEAGE